MSTPAQIDANRANAQLSSGPKTDEGKAASSKNNTSHGLSGTGFTVMPWESQLDFDALRDELRNEHRRKELAVLTAGAHLEFQLMENTCHYITEIRKDPAKDAKFSELLTRNGFDQEA